MKKFILRWGKGSVLGIKEEYKTMTVEAESIDNVDPTLILPNTIKCKIYYIRIIHTSDTKRNYDYGSYTEFVEAEEL